MPENLKSSVPPGLWASALRAADALKGARAVTVAAHIDADGISASAIAQTSLERAGARAEVKFFKKLDPQAIESLRSGGGDLTWFVDLGSGSVSRIEGSKAVVTDHHMPDTLAKGNEKTGQMLLSDFSTVVHVNPHLHGISGASDLSGAGSTFLAALAMDERNADLAHLAVLGSVGDLQDQRTRRLEGLNRAILKLAEEKGLVKTVEDIRYFGRETRPIHKLLEFSSDPFLPRITGNEDNSIAFLVELGIELKDGDSWRTWSDLTDSEKTKIIESLRDHLEQSRRRPETIARLVGEVYVLLKEEFATLLNACGRHGRGEIGLKICAGDRGEALTEGETLLKNHRSALSKALSWAKGSGIVRMRNIQFFDAGDEIEDTIVGIVAGMLLGGEGADRTAPMIAFAESTEYSDSPKVKASARGTQDLVSRGMDLSAAIRAAAEGVGGIGGGHNIAAGATIPADRKKDFLSALDDLVGKQISARGPRRG
ncbi:MAG: DHH family phosphoesterase [Thermoplasmata archaeon]|nr:DHH family phosphoesterase [Thermoplasmata archaeon]